MLIYSNIFVGIMECRNWNRDVGVSFSVVSETNNGNLKLWRLLYLAAKMAEKKNYVCKYMGKKEEKMFMIKCLKFVSKSGK